MNISKLPVVSYVRRYWWVLALLYLAYLAARSDDLFKILDIFVYLPLAFVAWVTLPLLWRNLFNARTTDKFVDSGNYAKSFNDATSEKKVELTVQQMNGYLIGSAIIVHALLSNLFG